MLRRLVLLLIIAGAAFVIGLVTYNDVAWRLSFSALDYQIGINAALLIAGIVAVLAVIYLLASLLRLPISYVMSHGKRKEERQAQRFRDALLLYAQGDWEAAYKQFKKVVGTPAYRFHGHLFAARAYLKQGKPEAAWMELQTAHQAPDKDIFALSLAEAEVLMAQDRRVQARQVLQRLHKDQGRNPRVAELLEECGGRE